MQVLSGPEGLIEAASEPCCSLVVTAVVGMIGIKPTMAAIRAKKDIALANKETLVTAGHLIIPLAKNTEFRFIRWTVNTPLFFSAFRESLTEMWIP